MAICALAHPFTTQLMEVLGLKGKKLSSLEVRIKLNLNGPIILEAKYDELFEEGTDSRLISALKQYDIKEREWQGAL